MPINIKNDRVSRLAQELAEKTGASITDAVGAAIEEKLERLDSQARRAGLTRRMRAITGEIAARTTDEWRTHDWEAELYGPHSSLPR